MSLLSSMADRWMGPCITRIEQDRQSGSPNLYLTFDDGPDPRMTPKILNLLEKSGVQATFFAIGKKAAANPQLTREIRQASHAVGNHSWDHDWRNYFRGKSAIRDWIQRGEDGLHALLNESNVGFRPPAGIRTPPLHQALRDLELPLVLWSVRFFDSQFDWKKAKALTAVENLVSGDIILLHDRIGRGSSGVFLDTLSVFIEKARERGFSFKPLRRDLF